MGPGEDMKWDLVIYIAMNYFYIQLTIVLCGILKYVILKRV